MQKIVIDISDNPDLSAYAQSKSPGDECELTFKMKFISADGGKMEADIEEIEYEYEGEFAETEPSEDEPVAAEVLIVSEMEEESSEEGRAPTTEESLYEEEED